MRSILDMFQPPGKVTMFGCHFLLLVLLFGNGRAEEAVSDEPAGEDTSGKPNWLTFALLGCAWGVVFILFVIAIILRQFNKPAVDTVNLTSSPTSYYMLKVKTGALPAGFLAGKHEICLDLISTRLQTLGRVKLPIKSTGTPGSSQIVYVKIGTREPFEVGSIRVEHNSYRGEVSLENIVLRELDGSGKIFRADVNTKISYNPNDKRQQTFKAYRDDTSFGTAELLEPGEDSLNSLEWVFFLFFAINLIIMLTLYVPKHVSKLEGYSDVAVTGTIAGIVSLAVTLLLLILYRLTIKKNLSQNTALWNGLHIAFFVICFLIAFALGVTAVILAAQAYISNEALTYWGVACAIALVIFLALFIPTVFAIEYCILCTMDSGVERSPSGEIKASKKESHGNEYFDAIAKKQGATPIRSISQYRQKPNPPAPVPAPRPPTPVQRPKVSKTPPPKAPPKSPPPRTPPPPPTPTRKASNESTGSEYFNQINRANVKSISQYAALKKK